MKKKILFGLLGVTVLVVAGIGIALWNINPIVESFRPRIAAMLSDTLKRDVDLGPIEVRFIPFGLDIQGVTLGGQTGTEPAKVSRLSLDAELGALLDRKLAVTRVAADNLQVVVRREKDGTVLVGGVPLKKERRAPASRPAPAGSPTDRPAEGAPGSPPADAGRAAEPPAPASDPRDAAAKQEIQLLIEKTELNDASIVWEDAAVDPPQRIELNNVDVELSDITKGGVGSFELAGNVLSKKDANLHVSGSAERREGQPIPAVKAELRFNDVDLDRLSGILAAYGVAPGATLKNALSFNSKLAVNTGAVTLSATVDATSAAITVADKFVKEARLPLKLDIDAKASLLGKIEATKALLVIGDTKIELPFTFDPISKTFNTHVRSSAIDLQTVARLVPPAQAFQPSGTLSVDLTVSRSGSADPAYGGTIDLKDVSAQAPAGTGKVIPLTGLTGSVKLEKDTITLKPFSGAVAGQRFDLGAKVVNPANPSIQAALKAPSLAFEPLLEIFNPEASEPLKSSNLNNVQITASAAKPSQNGSVSFATDGGTVAGYPLGATKATVDMVLDQSMKPVSFALQPSTLQLFGGTLQVDGRLSAEKRLAVNLKAQEMSLDKIMESTAPSAKVSITGTLQALALQLAGPQASIAKEGSGTLSATAANGEIRGINVLRATLEKIDTIPGLAGRLVEFVPPKLRPILDKEATEYRDLKLDAAIETGDVNARRFTLANEHYLLTGSGTYSRDGAIDFDAQLRLTPLLAEEMVRREPHLKLILDDDGNITIPVTIRRAAGGIFVVLPDASRLVKMGAKNTAKAAATRALDKVAPGLGGAIDSIFK